MVGMNTTTRQPRGIPTGGQFAPGIHAEPGTALDPDRDTRSPSVATDPDQIREWVTSQANHHISPVIGWIRRDAAKGNDTSGHVASFHERVELLAVDVADRFTAVPEALQQRTDATNIASEAIREKIQPVVRDLMAAAGDDSRITAIRWRAAAEAAADEIARKVTAPAPVLDGFSATDVEDYLAREQHERQCACDLPDDICRTESYGENWRYRMGVPDVEGIFGAIKEMAAARAANEEKETK